MRLFYYQSSHICHDLYENYNFFCIIHVHMYMYNTKKIIIFITHKMAITRKIHFQINFDYKVMTNYKIMSYCYMH